MSFEPENKNSHKNFLSYGVISKRSSRSKRKGIFSMKKFKY